MKMKLLRCMSILCTATLLTALPYRPNLINVQAELNYETADDDVFVDRSKVSKDGRFRYRLFERDDTVAIVGYIGEDANIIIPEKIDGKM